MPSRLTYLLLLASLGGCSSLPIATVSVPIESLPMAQPIGPARRIVQEITAIWPGHQDTLLCVLELDKQHIAVAGLSRDGISLFNLSYDGNKVAMEKSPFLPDNISPEIVIKDLQLVYWPLVELQKVLPSGWRLLADKHQRLLTFNNADHAHVTYPGPNDLWPKAAHLINQRYHYQLHIKTISYETVPE
jgi:Protein of unknown function (DUF3261)